MTTWLTRQEVAERLKLHPMSISRMSADGRLPKPAKIGGRQNSKSLYDADAVDEAVRRLAEREV